MSVTSEQRAFCDGLIRWAGGPMTLRRRNTLKSGASAVPVASLFVYGATLAGAFVIAFDAPHLKGALVAGSRWTIAGNATVYTTAETVEAADGRLVGITFTPALAANAADDAIVTIVQGYGDTTVYGVRSNFATTGEGRETVSRRAWEVSALGLAIVPETGDLLLDGDTETAVNVEVIGTGGAARYLLKAST